MDLDQRRDEVGCNIWSDIALVEKVWLYRRKHVEMKVCVLF